MFAEGSRNEQELAITGPVAKVEAFVGDNVLRISYRDERDEVVIPCSDDRIAYEGLHEGSSYLEHLDFFDAIRNGTPPKVTLADGLRSMAIGVAAPSIHR